MPDESLQIEIVGLDKLLAAFEKFPTKVAANLGIAGLESANKILDTKGMRNYPKGTKANKPPTPYYIRGRGTQSSPGTNLYNSENLGKQWVIERKGLQTSIGNRASYAKWVHDDKLQARAMHKIGWRKLFDVAKEKLGAIQKVYQQWVDKTLRDVNLK